MQGSPRIDELRQKFHENPRRYFAPLANEYRKAGDPEQAIAICRAHLAQQPGHMSGHVVYGQALYDAKRPDEARVVFEKALSLDPDNAIVLRQLGDIAREKGDNQEAKHWYARALDADPGDSEVAAYIAELTEPVTDEVSEKAEAAETPSEAAAETIPETGMPSEPELPPEPEAPAQPEAPSEPEAPADVEVPLPAASHEPETEPAPAIASPPDQETPPPLSITEEEEVAWRKTPPHEDSPFVTRTMAELYAKQGYRSAALDVYRQLALHHPDDREIMDRIEELSKEPVAEVAPESPVEAPVDAGEPAAPNSPVAEEPFAFQELDNEIAFSPSSEDLNLVSDSSSDAPQKHFTENELGGLGDSWDSDSWAAGFSVDEGIDLEFNTADAGLETPTAPPSEDVIESREPEPEPEPVPLPQVEAEPEPEPIAATDALVEPEPAAEPEAEAPVETEAPAEAEAEEEQEPIVAYSPELPENEELPHYAPRGQTIRELFAVLGARKPPTATSYTARAAVPEFSSQPLEEPAAEPADLPLATDAFANMFAEEAVSDEDSRAAFALSGAITASETPASRVPTPPRPAAAQEPATPAVPATTEESEEDIRRFREWLDGLQDT